MAKHIQDLRRDLARDVGRFLEGVADTGGGAGTMVDADGLAGLFTEPDALVGGMIYIRAAAGAAPETEWSWVTSYAGTGGTVEVDPVFSAAVDSGDQYEIYLAPMALPQWDKAINEAIEEAWPQVYEIRVWEEPAADVDRYLLPDDVEAVIAVEVGMVGQYAGYPAQTMPRSLWHTVGTPGEELFLILQRTVPSEGRELRISYKHRYAEIADESVGYETELDYPYLLAAGKRNVYEMLAAEGDQTDVRRMLQLMVQWGEQAQKRKNHLEAMLLDTPVIATERKK